MNLKTNSKTSFSKTFTKKDIETFAKEPRLQGIYYTSNDKERQAIQGLLTSTLSTKLKDEKEVLAQSMNFKFLNSLYTASTITCMATIENYTRKKMGAH